jgi:cobalt-zinc-cadmium resistance protein CzcA
MEVMSGVQGENSVKIFGPDLDRLERTGERVRQTLAGIPGIEDPAVYRIQGQSNFDLPIDRDKCALWNVNVADVQNVIQTAVGGKPSSQMVEGERTFDITLRWPERLRANEDRILDIPVDVTGHTVTPGSLPSLAPTPMSGASTGVSPTGTSAAFPSLTGSLFNAPPSGSPRRRLRDLLTPSGEDGHAEGQGSFTRPGVSMVYREQGQRLVSVKFSVRGRDLASTVAEAQARVAPLLQAPYRAEWSGEFEEMGQAERRLLVIIPLAVVLIFLLLYLAFGSLLDVAAVLANVLAIGMGGVWALWATGTSFSVSAAVGFISIFGVAVMDGLLLISCFNTLRAQGLPLREAILQGASRRIRPVMMTALTAVFGLLPAAVSTRIGANVQRPLAIVVVGGMLLALLFNRYLLPVLYSFYGHREPPARAETLTH